MRHAISFALLGAAPALLGCGSLDRATDVATGYVSHQLCSATFVSRVEPEQFYREAIAPMLAPVGFLSGHQVDRDRAQVTASFAGVAQARAVDRGPLGCLVLHGEPPAPVALAPHTPAPALLPTIAGPAVVEPAQPALQAGARSRLRRERITALSQYQGRRRRARRPGDRRALCPGLRHRHPGHGLVGHQVRHQRPDRHPGAAGQARARRPRADRRLGQPEAIPATPSRSTTCCA